MSIVMEEQAAPASPRHSGYGQKNMRVLLISHTCQSPVEGQPKAECLAVMPGMDLITLIPDRWFHNGKWRNAAITPNPHSRYEIGKVVMPWMGPGQFYMHSYRGLGKLIRDFKPDIIDLWEEAWGFVSAQAVYLRNKHLPTCRVITETEQNISRALPLPFERSRKYVLKHADFAVCRNREAVDVLKEKGYRGESEVVPNAVDEKLFVPMDREACRVKFQMKDFVVGYIGRFVARKGIDDLLHAVAKCPPNVRCVLVGSGEEESNLRTLIQTLGIADRVLIISELPAKDLVPVMNAINVLALPSKTVKTWKEQFGRVIIEAHACATPVIGSDSGAIPEVIGQGGLVFPEGNVNALAECLKKLASNTALCRSFGEAGRRAVFEKYTWDRVAEKMYSVYLHVMNRPSRALQQ